MTSMNRVRAGERPGAVSALSASRQRVLSRRRPALPRSGPAGERGGAALLASAAVLIVLAAAFLFFHFRSPRDGDSSGNQAAVVTVRRKTFTRVLRLAGSTAALHSRPILAPRLAGAQLGSMVITGLAPAGTRVKKGDLLVEFDRQEQYKDFLDKQAAYRDLVNQVAGKRAAADAARAKDDTALKQAEDALATAKLEMKKVEIESRIDAEKARETLQEAQATLKQLRHTYSLKRQAAQAEIRALEIQLKRARQTMLYAQSNARKMLVHSPMDGVVVLNDIWLNGRMGHVQRGSSVRPGVPFMRVVDPSGMDVRAPVDQADLLSLRVGQHAVIRLDAYPGLSFPGRLEEISPLGYPGRYSGKVRSFTVVFSIQGSNPKLMPDLSAAVDVELAREKNALVVPVQSVAHDKSGEFVWLKDGGGFEKRRVRTGEANDLEVVIESGLKAGDVIRENAGAGGASGGAQAGK